MTPKIDLKKYPKRTKEWEYLEELAKAKKRIMHHQEWITYYTEKIKVVDKQLKKMEKLKARLDNGETP